MVVHLCTGEFLVLNPLLLPCIKSWQPEEGPSLFGETDVEEV